MTAAFDPDELAGIVDLFGALTPTELERALEELAFKRGEEIDSDAITSAVEAAVSSYALVRYVDSDGAAADEAGDSATTGEAGDSATTGEAGDSPPTYLTPGPAAFPTLPDNAEDLPHILDVPKREVDTSAAGVAVAERLRSEAATAVAGGDEQAMRRLLDVTYDVAVWSDAVAVDDIRDRLDDALDTE